MIYYVREKKKGWLDEVAAFINNIYPKKSGIIYCLRKKEAETLSEKLNNDHNIKSNFYHGGVDVKLREVI